MLGKFKSLLKGKKKSRKYLEIINRKPDFKDFF